MGALGRGRYGRQPPEPVGVAWGNPLAKGIAFAAASHGGVFKDYVSGNLPASGTGTRSNSVYQFGKSRRYAVGSDFFTTPASMDAPTRYSWLVRAKWVTITNYSGIFGKTSNLGTTNGWSSFSGAGGAEMQVGHTISSAILDNTSNLTGTGICNVLVTWDGATVSWYRDGKLITSAAFSSAVVSGNGYVKIASNRDTHNSTCWHDHTIVWPGRALSPAEATYLTTGDASYELFMSRRIWVPVSAGGGGLLDLTGSQTASLTGAVTATGDLQYAINLAGAQTASLSGALTVSGDIQITPAPTLDLSGSQTAALAGVLSATGDLQYTLPVDLAASAAALSGSLSIAGDLEYSTAVFLDIAAQPIALAGTFSSSGDLDPYPSLNLSGAQSAALSGVIAASGNLQYTVPFDVSQTGTTALTGTLNLSGDLEYSTTPVPPPVSPGWGGGAVGGGGRGLRELTARIGKDAEDLLEHKRKVPDAADQAKAASPDPTAQRVAAARSAKNSAAAPAPVAQPSQSDSPAEILSELRLLRGAVEKLEALILADREEARKRREQDEEEAAVVKLLLN